MLPSDVTSFIKLVELEAVLNWYSTCLASSRPEFKPLPENTKIKVCAIINVLNGPTGVSKLRCRCKTRWTRMEDPAVGCKYPEIHSPQHTVPEPTNPNPDG
jgi:hypothetical protein